MRRRWTAPYCPCPRPTITWCCRAWGARSRTSTARSTRSSPGWATSSSGSPGGRRSPRRSRGGWTPLSPLERRGELPLADFLRRERRRLLEVRGRVLRDVPGIGGRERWRVAVRDAIRRLHANTEVVHHVSAEIRRVGHEPDARQPQREI